MPELPEIETVKLQLQTHLVGLTIKKLEQKHVKSVIGDAKLVIGKKVTGVRRFGKMLVIDLSHSLHLAIHFKMSGQLVLQPHPDPLLAKERELRRRIVGGHPTKDWIKQLPSNHTRAIFHFKNGDRMYFNDQRIFGWIKILSTKELANLAFMQKLGKEPWDISFTEFYELISKKKKAIKVLIMEQEALSGVGNIYANDALWEARIHPARKAQEVTKEESKKLRAGLIKVLKEGIKYGGATAADAKYIDLEGLGGTYQDHFRVYDRAKQPCLRDDGGVIEKTVLGGRGTYYCPVCQR